MSYHTAATHDDASKFRKRMQERVREAEKRRVQESSGTHSCQWRGGIAGASRQVIPRVTLVPKARAK